MARMDEALHDRIDVQEDLRERAAAIVEDAKLHLVDIVGRIDTDDDDAMEQAFEAVAALVGERLAALTTEAVGLGHGHAKRIVSIK